MGDITESGWSLKDEKLHDSQCENIFRVIKQVESVGRSKYNVRITSVLTIDFGGEI